MHNNTHGLKKKSHGCSNFDLFFVLTTYVYISCINDMYCVMCVYIEILINIKQT